MKWSMGIWLAAILFAMQSMGGVAAEPSLAEQAKAMLAKHQSLSYALPGNPIYLSPEGRKELNFSEEQMGTIRDIGLVFNGKVADQRNAANADERAQAEKLKGDELKKFQEGFLAREAKRIEQRRAWAIEARRQMEKVLTEKQLQQLREMEFAKRIEFLMYQPQLIGQLKLDAQQQAKAKEVQSAVEKRRLELTQEMLKLQTDGSKKLVELLTPEQRESLRQRLETMYESTLQVR